MFAKLLKLIMNYTLNDGVKTSDVTKFSLDVKPSNGMPTLGINAIITIETKQALTPKENRRRIMVILFLVSLVFMLGLSTVGLLLPYAGLGRMLVLLSEIPAFVFSLVCTRFLTRNSRRRVSHQA
jgi:heme A synthase